MYCLYLFSSAVLAQGRQRKRLAPKSQKQKHTEPRMLVPPAFADIAPGLLECGKPMENQKQVSHRLTRSLGLRLESQKSASHNPV
jgi:hypothetical protein